MSSGKQKSAPVAQPVYTGGGSNSNTTQTQTFTPYGGAMPAYDQLMAQTNAMAAAGPQWVGPSQQTMEGLAAMYQGLEGASGLLPTADANYKFLSSAADVANNEYVQKMLATNASQAKDALGVGMQGLSAGAQNVNAMGSSRLGLAQGQAIGDSQKALTNANNNLMMGAYSQGLSAQQNALAGLGALQGAHMMPAQTLGQAGQMMEGYEQNRINAPWQHIQNIGSALQYTNPLGVLSGTGGTQGWSNSGPAGAYGGGYGSGGGTTYGSGGQSPYGGGQSPYGGGGYNAPNPWFTPGT